MAVLATGSQPLVPPLEGMTADDGELRPGVFVYRTMDDCTRMRAHARPGDSAIVLGGGLLGLEAAKVLADRGLHVTVVHGAKTLMNAQLDAMGGEMLARQIERCGIFVRTAHTVEAILGDLVVEGVGSTTARRCPPTWSCSPAASARASTWRAPPGSPSTAGIVVNDTLATEVPGVYAIGECAEHARPGPTASSRPPGSRPPCSPTCSAGTNPQARYRGSKLYTRLKVAGVDVASMGRVEPELETDEVIQVVETAARLLPQAHRARRQARRRDARRQHRGGGGPRADLRPRRPLPADPLEALCPTPPSAPGARASASSAPATRSARRLCEAIAGGACTVEALGEPTRAGTGCGSCKPELVQLIANNAPPPKLAAAG